MIKTVFFVLAISFSWYVVNDVYGKPNVASSNLLASPKAHDIPELTPERIELLKRIAGMSNTGLTNPVSTIPQSTNLELVSRNKSDSDGGVQSTGSEWRSYQGVDKYNGTKEGLASSGWTTVTTSSNKKSGNTQVALVASCDDNGEKSVYIKMLPAYPYTDGTQRVDIVNGQVGWDSSNPYGATFSYDIELNALRLQAGLEDSLSMIKAGNKVRFQVAWHDGHQADFEFSLKGSSRALETAFAYCLSHAG